jgi:uncharacterized membrane protein
MSLDPLLAAPFYIQVHAFGAMKAFVLGLAQFTLRKGTQIHRVMGYVWVTTMLVISVTSFFIHNIRSIGPFSLIHLLSILTIYSSVAAVMHARAGRIRAHRLNVIVLFCAALIGAGVFAFVPPRIMGQVVFGV